MRMELKNLSIFSFMTSPDHLLPEEIQENDLKLGLRLKDLLNERRLTGQWLAEQVGVSPPSISKILAGKSRPRINTFNRIAHALARSPAEERDLISAYHGLDAPPPVETRIERYYQQLSDDAWAAKQQIVKVMENRAYQADFRRVVEEALISLGLEYQKDFAENGAATDFMVSFDDKKVAIECRPQIHRHLAQTFGFSYLVSERLNPDKVLIVTAFAAKVTRPADMPRNILILPFQDLKPTLTQFLPQSEDD